MHPGDHTNCLPPSRSGTPESCGCYPKEITPSQRARRTSSAFTLVEVVIALGIFIFALVAIGGLFFVGLNINKESSEQIQAANLASLLISTRRAIPVDPLGTPNPLGNFALPPLNAPTSGNYKMGVADDGTVGSATGSPAYNLFYQVSTNAVAGAHLAQVHLLLWWPATLTTPPNNPSSRYELTTLVALP